jgi:hypothetical protein
LESLLKLEAAVGSIETALRNGIKLDTAGGEINIVRPVGEYDKAKVKIIAKQLVQNKNEVKDILLSGKFVAEMLCKGQGWLSESQRVFLLTLDLWTRLDDIGSKVFSFTECISGDKGCPEDAIITCDFCVKGGKNGI